MRAFLERYYRRVTESIAFLPTVIAIGFATASFLVVTLQSSEAGAWLLERVPVLDFRDLSTARTILGSLVGGVMGLTVFSFSMVMIVLSQAAANLTPKILDSLTRERAYQRVLGVYVGTTVYCLLLLINVERSTEQTGRMPSIGVFLGVAFGVLCVALFIYFIHKIADAVKPRSIIDRIRSETERSLRALEESNSVSPEDVARALDGLQWHACASPKSGYLQAVSSDLVDLASECDFVVAVHRRRGEHVLEGTPLFAVSGDRPLSDEEFARLEQGFMFYGGENISDNWYYGFRQLGEIAAKALSPGINDPGTAVLCIEAFAPLLVQLLRSAPDRSRTDDADKLRLIFTPYEPSEVLRLCVSPIRHYGRSDANLLRSLLAMLRHVADALDDPSEGREALRAQAEEIVIESRRSLTNPSDLRSLETEVCRLREFGAPFEGLTQVT